MEKKKRALVLRAWEAAIRRFCDQIFWRVLACVGVFGVCWRVWRVGVWRVWRVGVFGVWRWRVGVYKRGKMCQFLLAPHRLGLLPE